MDTPTITQYYRESDPARRLALLNMSIEAGEEPELNQIRKELWTSVIRIRLSLAVIPGLTV